MITRTLQCILSMSVLLSLNACAEQAEQIDATQSNPEVVVGGQRLTLESHAQRCALRKPDQSLLTLDMPWPCHLSIDRNGQPRVESFNNAQIIIVQHFAPEPAPSQECRSQYQAIRHIEGRLEASMVANGGHCLLGAMDQKNFVALFTW